MENQGRYATLSEIASGSTATVFLAEDRVLRRKVALKKLHPHLLNHEEAVRRFEKEAVAVASLSHENVIKIYDFGRQGNGLFLAMEYVDGASLERVLNSIRSPLPALVALSLFQQLLRGLAAAHERGIFHRDIKPGNVLVDSKGCVRVADFGIAFLAEETSITKTGSYLGTPGYSAPEQAEGKPATDKTDVFATGILFYRCLTGKLPFEAETPHAVLIAIMDKAQTKAHLINRRMLPGMTELIDAMLAKNPAERPSAREALQRLDTRARELGLPIDPNRICRFLSHPQAYAAEENKEIAAHFVAHARVTAQKGDARLSLRLYSQAELFAGPDAALQKEAAQAWQAEKWKSRRGKTMIAASILAVVLIGAVFIQRELAGHPATGVTSELPKAEINHPVEKPVESAAADAAPAKAAVERKPALSAEPEAGTRQPMQPVRLARASGAPIKKHRPAENHVHAEKAPSQEAMGSSVTKPAVEPVPVPSAVPTQTGYLMIKTNPPFAGFSVDGRDAGVTPTKTPLELRTGEHLLTLEREGCKTLRASFSISPREITSLRYTLEKGSGTAP